MNTTTSAAGKASIARFPAIRPTATIVQKLGIAMDACPVQREPAAKN